MVCTLAKESRIKSYMSVSGAVTAVTHAPVTVTLRVTRYVTVTLHGDPGGNERKKKKKKKREERTSMSNVACGVPHTFLPARTHA